MRERREVSRLLRTRVRLSLGLPIMDVPHLRLALLQAPRQSRHPERSASQICRITKRSMARSRRACPEPSRRNPGNAAWRMLLKAFRPQTKTEANKITCSRLWTEGLFPLGKQSHARFQKVVCCRKSGSSSLRGNSCSHAGLRPETLALLIPHEVPWGVTGCPLRYSGEFHVYAENRNPV
jgi:hypothetical protein